MDNKNFRDAFDPVRPSEEVKRNVLNMAADREKQPGKLRRAAIRVAAVAAAVAIFVTAMLWPRKTEDGIVTAPGVLKVYAYDVTSGSSIENMVSCELEEGALYPQCFYMPGLNSLRGLPMMFYTDEEELTGMNITFDVTANYGALYGDQYNSKYREDPDGLLPTWNDVYFGNHAVIDNGELIHWNGDALVYGEGGEPDPKYFEAQLNVIIHADAHIVGYTVVDIVCVDRDTLAVVAQVRKAEYFPPVDGAFQNVTEEDVVQKMATSQRGD